MKVSDNRPDSFAVLEVNGQEVRMTRDDLVALLRLCQTAEREIFGLLGLTPTGWTVRTRDEHERKMGAGL